MRFSFYLIIFFVILFTPLNSTLAQITSLTISSDKTTIASGEEATITVKTQKVNGISIAFSAYPPGQRSVITGSPCTPTGSTSSTEYSCSVKFSSVITGMDYLITAITMPPTPSIISNQITVKISGAVVATQIAPTCNDKKDNDGDDLIDIADPDCHSDGNASNSGSYQALYSEKSSIYNFLAPLPCDAGTPGCVNGELANFDPARPNALSTYLNIMIKIALGLAAVLAMIMIVMGGIQYMTSDLISSKEEGKKRITNAVIGLIIALGAYLILFTINPDLLDIEPELPEATLEYTESPPTAADYDSPNVAIPTGAIRTCTQGIVKVTASLGPSVPVCASIKSNIEAMFNKAKREGVPLGGWGWRSYAKQIELRKKNGCPDIYTSPASDCRIPTAIPGTSMHESGLALDLTCNGISIQTHDNKCFIWLQANTTTHKLINFKKEPWHWSTTGK